MMEYKVDLEDIRFVLKEQAHIEELFDMELFQDYSWEDVEMVLAEGHKVAAEVIHPLKSVSDSVGARMINGKVVMPEEFHSAHKIVADGGWMGVSTNTKLGGQGFPHAVGAACGDMFIAACPSFFFLPGLARGASRLIEEAGSQEQIDTYCEKMNTGVWGGTMCLTESQAGSAVGDLSTQAIPVEGEDYYLIKGNKIFISAGDQDITENIIHLVLARTPDAPRGIRGVTLFIVPRIRKDGSDNDVICNGIEEKMGLHGSPTCQMAFGDRDDCRGMIVGKEGKGIKNMFVMMNEARIAVGLQASSMANWAYQLAVAYAKERIQGTDIKSFKDAEAERIPIIQHPDVRRMLITMKTYSEGCRSLLYCTAAMVDRMEACKDSNEADRLRNLVEILTPICKAYCSYRGFEVADQAIMVHGGYGYIREYAVEGVLRDIKIAAIYEGTNGIQALDLLGRKVASKGGLAFMTFIQWVNEFIAANKGHVALSDEIDALEKAKNTLSAITMELGQIGMGGDIYYPVLQASPYLELFGDVVFGRQLLEQAVIAHSKLDGASESKTRFYKGKLLSARFFVSNQLPRVEMLAQTIRSGDKSALEIEF